MRAVRLAGIARRVVQVGEGERCIQRLAGQLLQAFVQNTGMYISNVFAMTFNLYAYDQRPTWLGGWTLFYWAWWIAWSPFVGMFIARISYGLTLRRFIIGAMIAPVLTEWLARKVFGTSKCRRTRSCSSPRAWALPASS